jgi:hypothetical protein
MLCPLMVQASLPPMAPPMVNIPFVDPDFGSQTVRVTDETSHFLHPGGTC